MKSTLILDENWDLKLDNSGNIAIADDDYAPCQDVCSYTRTWSGEVMFDQTLGIPYDSSVLVANPDLHLYKELLEACGNEVDGISQCVAKLGQVGSDRELKGMLILQLENGNKYYAAV